MKKIIHKNLFETFASKALLAVSGGLLVVSCGTQMGGYSETDGVYYDPNKDTLPEGVVIDKQGNRVGDYYDYQDSSIIENSNENIADKNNRYDNWNDVSPSDWGAYAGSETNYYSDYWGSPWGWYSPYNTWGWGGGFGMSFGWGNSWGWYNPYMNWGWGSPFGWGGYYGYSPFYSGFYSPFYGYNPYGFYSPYYGGGYYGYYSNPYRYQRSGADGRSYNTYQQNQGTLLRTQSNSAFRNNANETRLRNQAVNSNRLNNSTQPRYRNVPNGNIRNSQPGIYQNPRQQQPRQMQQPRQQQPRQMQQPRQYEPTRSNDRGFRSGSDSGFRSNSGGFGGGSSGGSRSGGGTRSGGFR